VDGSTARIGDGRSLWDSGVLSFVNAPAAALGARPGMRVQDFVAAVTSAR
jgi:hypothetical protein